RLLSGKACERKLRLFAANCIRQVVDYFALANNPSAKKRIRHAIENSEWDADSIVIPEFILSSIQDAYSCSELVVSNNPDPDVWAAAKAFHVFAVFAESSILWVQRCNEIERDRVVYDVRNVADVARYVVQAVKRHSQKGRKVSRDTERARQAALLRHLIGN